MALDSAKQEWDNLKNCQKWSRIQVHQRCRLLYYREN